MLRMKTACNSRDEHTLTKALALVYIVELQSITSPERIKMRSSDDKNPSWKQLSRTDNKMQCCSENAVR